MSVKYLFTLVSFCFIWGDVHAQALHNAVASISPSEYAVRGGAWTNVSPRENASGYYIVFGEKNVDARHMRDVIFEVFNESRTELLWSSTLGDIDERLQSVRLYEDIIAIRLRHRNNSILDETENYIKFRLVSILSKVETRSEFDVPNYRLAASVSNPDFISNAAEHSLVLVQFSKDGKVYQCTGFFISKSIAITNNHCISDGRVLDEIYRARLYLKYENVDRYGNVVLVDKVLTFENSDRLDYTLLAVDESTFEATPVVMSDVDIEDDMPLLLLQHFGGGVAVVSYDNDCRVFDRSVEGLPGFGFSDFTHKCDTEKISSGSPVFDSVRGMVVGLHHFGKVDGIWDTNKAVSASLILEDLRENGIQLHKDSVTTD